MKHYGIENEGELILEIVTTLPVHTFADEGRILYNKADGQVYHGTTIAWVLSGSGYSGYSGISGYSGYSGISGYSGSDAQQSGYSGYSSKSGYSGISGYSGYSGKSGYSGYSGYSGRSGYSGYSGMTSYVGGYLHNQIASSDTWTITHNLNYRCPVVTVWDSTNIVITPSSITATDDNTITITFATAKTGKVAISIGGQATSGYSGLNGSLATGFPFYDATETLHVIPFVV